MSTSNRTWWGLPALLLALAGTIPLLVATAAFGPVTTPDSAHYLAAARSFAESGRFLGYDGTPMVYWPPMYPAVLGVFDRILPGDTIAAARLGGAMLFATASLLFVSLARRMLVSAGAVLFAAAGWCLATTMYLVFGAALSEGLFIVCALLLLLAMTQPVGLLRTFTVCIALAAACMTRYIGVSLCVAVVLFEWSRTRSLRGAVRAGLLCGVAVLPLALWMLRIRLLGDQADARPAAMVGSLVNARSGLDVATQFLFPAAVPLVLRLLALAVIAGLAVWRFRRNTSAAAAGTIAGIAIATAAYFLVLLALARVTYMDTFDFRLMSPLFPLLLLIAAYALDGLFLQSRAVVRLAAGAAALVVVGFFASRAVSFARHGQRDGVGMYTSREWREDSTLAALRETARGEPLFSNAADALYINTGLAVRMLPVRETASLHPLPATFLLHWQKNFWRTYTISPADLAARHQLHAQHDDVRGTIYRVTRLPQSDEARP